MERQDIKAMEIMRKVAGKFSKVDEIQAALASAYTRALRLFCG